MQAKSDTKFSRTENDSEFSRTEENLHSGIKSQIPN